MRSLFNVLAGAVLALGLSLYACPEAKACDDCCCEHHHHCCWWESCTHHHTYYSSCWEHWPTGDTRNVYLDTHYYTHWYPCYGCCR